MPKFMYLIVESMFSRVLNMDRMYTCNHTDSTAKEYTLDTSKNSTDSLIMK